MSDSKHKTILITAMAAGLLAAAQAGADAPAADGERPALASVSGGDSQPVGPGEASVLHPDPGNLALLGFGLLGLAVVIRGVARKR